jgi:hypothetical protein
MFFSCFLFSPYFSPSIFQCIFVCLLSSNSLLFFLFLYFLSPCLSIFLILSWLLFPVAASFFLFSFISNLFFQFPIFLYVFLSPLLPFFLMYATSSLCTYFYTNVRHIHFRVEGQKWKGHRRLIQPSFHLSVLEGFIGTFYESARFLVANLSSEEDLRSINITAPVNQCVLNILHGEEPACVLLLTK